MKKRSVLATCSVLLLAAIVGIAMVNCGGSDNPYIPPHPNPDPTPTGQNLIILASKEFVVQAQPNSAAEGENAAMADGIVVSVLQCPEIQGQEDCEALGCTWYTTPAPAHCDSFYALLDFTIAQDTQFNITLTKNQTPECEDGSVELGTMGEFVTDNAPALKNFSQLMLIGMSHGLVGESDASEVIDLTIEGDIFKDLDGTWDPNNPTSIGPLVDDETDAADDPRISQLASTIGDDDVECSTLSSSETCEANRGCIWVNPGSGDASCVGLMPWITWSTDPNSAEPNAPAGNDKLVGDCSFIYAQKYSGHLRMDFAGVPIQCPDPNQPLQGCYYSYECVKASDGKNYCNPPEGGTGHSLVFVTDNTTLEYKGGLVGMCVDQGICEKTAIEAADAPFQLAADTLCTHAWQTAHANDDLSDLEFVGYLSGKKRDGTKVDARTAIANNEVQGNDWALYSGDPNSPYGSRLAMSSWELFSTGPRVPIDMTENGQKYTGDVWTGSHEDGTYLNPYAMGTHCTGTAQDLGDLAWNSSTSFTLRTGSCGNAGKSGNDGWSDNTWVWGFFPANCLYNKALYCFQKAP